MNVLSSGRQLDSWEGREGRVFAALPYGLLAITVIVSVFARGGLGVATLLDFALAAAAAVWMLWMVTLHPAWRERPRLMAFYFIVLIVLMAVMVIRAPWFGFFAWTGYLQLGYAQSGYALRGGWRLVGGVAVAIVTATAQAGGLPSANPGALSTYFILIAVNIVIAGIMIWFSLVGAEQGERRKQALVALTEANQKLEASLQENAGLHAQLLTQAREAGILDERQRMAREIHDTLAQGFTGIITQLEAAKRIRQHPEQWQMHVDQAQRLARESLVEARRSVQALRPAPLDHSRLPEAIATTAQRWSETAAIPLTVGTIGEPLPLLAEIEVTLFRVAQEALTNVAKHAQASRVGVTLSYLDDLVLLDVRDDGVGFCIDAVNANGASAEREGFGLSAMRQRVRQVAGTLTIESTPGEGTAINVSVPAIPAGGSA